MNNDESPAAKNPPKPSKASIDVANYFELQLIDISTKSYKNKEYLKSALMSWSFIEEFFLPHSLRFISEKQKISINSEMLGANVSHLIRYYYFVSYDEEMYKILCEAAKLRNSLVHRNYKSGSIHEIAKRAQESAKYNLYTAFGPMADRLTGKTISPSLRIYSQGWNDCRDKMVENLGLRKKELEAELADLKKK